MITLPGRFIFAPTPRTGGRAIAAALITLEGAYASKYHHEHPEDIPTGWTVYSVIRDPYHQTLSWFYHAIVRHDPVQAHAERFHRFITEARISWFFDQRLNPYHEIATKTFIYRPDLSETVSLMLKEINLAQTLSCSTIGKSTDVKPQLIDARARELINERFPEDIELYQSVLERERLLHDS
jgi:hypothetical protein